MRKIYYLIIFTIFFLSVGCSSTTESDKNYWKQIQDNYHVYAPPLPESLDFAGEQVPLKYFDVRESLDREILKLMYWHSEIFLYLKRARRYFPIVEPILRKNGIPDDFKYMMVAESGMAPVSSPAGASGYWQFMEKIGKKYGLEINDQVDERYNIYKSTVAACNYLKDAYNHYGNWTLAAASFNVGQTSLDRAIKKQKQNSFYDLALNVQTARYIYRILALKLIMGNPQKYGFIIRGKELYKPLRINFIEVKTSIPSWPDFAIANGTNYKVLLLLNPWIRSSKLDNPEAKTYYVAVPKKHARIVKD